MKIGDFGFCLNLNEVAAPTEPTKNGGFHQPPGVDDAHPYDEKGDIYCLGIVFYELLSLIDLSRRTLYEANTTTTTATFIRPFLISHLSALQFRFESATELITQMIDDTPSKRPDAKTVHDGLCRMLKQQEASQKQGLIASPPFLNVRSVSVMAV